MKQETINKKILALTECTEHSWALRNALVNLIHQGNLKFSDLKKSVHQVESVGHGPWCECERKDCEIGHTEDLYELGECTKLPEDCGVYKTHFHCQWCGKITGVG